MYADFDVANIGHVIMGLLWLASWPLYFCFIIWAFWSLSKFFNYYPNGFTNSAERIHDITYDLDDDCYFIVPTSSLIICTAIINIRYSHGKLLNFLDVFFVLLIFVAVYFILIIINKNLVKIKKLNQDYLLVVELTIMLIFYFFSFYGVIKMGNIVIPVNFWFYNVSTFIFILILCLFIFSVKSLLSYFILYNTFFVISLFIYSFLFDLSTNIGILLLLFLTPTVFLLLVLTASRFVNLMPEEKLFFPEQKSQTSLKSYIIITIILFINIFILCLMIVRGNIILKYNNFDGINLIRLGGVLSVNRICYYIILSFYLLYFIFFLKYFSCNIIFMKKIFDKQKIIKKTFGISSGIIIDDHGKLIGMKEKILLNEIIRKNNFSVGIQIYDNIDDKDHSLNLFLTCYMLEHPEKINYSVLKDNYDMFLKNYVKTNIEPSKTFIDYIFFVNGNAIDYQIKEEIIFNLLSELRKYNEINQHYISMIKRFLEKCYLTYHHDTITTSGNSDIKFNKLFELLFKNDNLNSTKNISVTIDYNTLLKNAISENNISLVRELYYMNKYELKLNIYLLNRYTTLNYHHRAENYINTLANIVSIKTIDNFVLPENFCVIENDTIKTFYPSFFEYLFKENKFNNTFFKFAINPEKFIIFLSLLYELKNEVFINYSKCIVRIIEDSIIDDYENIIINSNHTFNSFYMLMRFIKLAEKDDSKSVLNKIIYNIFQPPYDRYVNNIFTKDNISIPVLIDYTNNKIREEQL